MNLDDITQGERLRHIETGEEGPVEHIDYEDEVIFVRFPTSLGSELVEVDPSEVERIKT